MTYQYRERPPSDWQEVHRVRDDETKAVVKIVQDMTVKFPRFSIEIGQDIGRDDGYIGRRIPVFLDRGQDQEINQRHDFLDDSIGTLVEEAQVWILARAREMDADWKKIRERREQESSER